MAAKKKTEIDHDALADTLEAFRQELIDVRADLKGLRDTLRKGGFKV